MDSLHEEVYLGTLWFFRLLGRHARGEELTYPGRVLPMMRPKNDGKPGEAKITFTGFATSRPAVVVEYQERGGNKGKSRLGRTEDRDGTAEGPRRLGAGGPERPRPAARLVKVNSEKDERGELVKRAPKEDVDEEVLSAEQVLAMVENLARLRASGMYLDTLAYHDLGALEFAAAWEREIKPETQNRDRAPAQRETGAFPGHSQPASRRLQVPGRESGPVGYADAASRGQCGDGQDVDIPEVTAYKVGETYLGKDVWAMDLMPPVEASHWSHAKATTLKPRSSTRRDSTPTRSLRRVMSSSWPRYS